MELVDNLLKLTMVIPCSQGVGERTREGTDLCDEMIESGVIISSSKCKHPTYLIILAIVSVVA